MRQKIRRFLVIFSFLVFPVTFYLLSPYLVIMGASERILSGSGFVFLLLFLSSLFLGRAFCGWVCPAGGFQDALFNIKGKRFPGKHWIKFLVFVPWFSIILIVAVNKGGFSEFRFLYKLESGVSIIQPYAFITYYIVTGLILILALSLGRRGFCHTSCWMAPFMMAGRGIRNIFKWPSLRLSADKSKCTHCLDCTKKCPMSIDVHDKVNSLSMEHVDCALCCECADGCTAKVISLKFASGN